MPLPDRTPSARYEPGRPERPALNSPGQRLRLSDRVRTRRSAEGSCSRRRSAPPSWAASRSRTAGRQIRPRILRSRAKGTLEQSGSDVFLERRLTGLPSIGPPVETLSAQVHTDDGPVIMQMKVQPHVGPLEQHGRPSPAFLAEAVHSERTVGGQMIRPGALRRPFAELLGRAGGEILLGQ